MIEELQQVQVAVKKVNVQDKVKVMPTIRQYADATDRTHVVELWRRVFGYETAHNEPNLAMTLPSFTGPLIRALMRPAFAGRQAMPARTALG